MQERDDGELRLRLADLEAENARLRGLLGLDRADLSTPVTAWEPTLFGDGPAAGASAAVDRHSSRTEKVALFMSLFAGRDDVYAQRWANPKTGKAGWGPVVRGGWSNARKPNREFLPLTDEVVSSHLAGEVHAGLYPLVRGDVCRLLVCDFDGHGWTLDALAYLDAARALGAPAALERSRSGNGGHVWLCFSGLVPASSARRIGVYLLREAMTARAELDLISYDRLFPSQDFVPKGSFGNLIALPLQGECRKRGTTVFLDHSTLEPVTDQWAFLAQLPRLSPAAVAAIADDVGQVDAGPDAVSYRRPRVAGPTPPETIRATAGAMLAIDRIGVPPALVAALKHLGSVHNPDFYEKEKMRFSTWNIPRLIRCYRETLGHLLLPRGLKERAESLVTEAGSRLAIDELWAEPEPISCELRAELSVEQLTAVGALGEHDLGMLVAPPGSGKTVIACALIARHRVPTLVIVDREPLIDQWRQRLATHLGLDRKLIGQIGAGRDRRTGVVDLAMAQSLARREDLSEVCGGYGMVIVDECHHVPAVTFERAVRQIPVRRWLGLTATPCRRDGLQALMAMHCGPIRHRLAGSAAGHPLRQLQVVLHETAHPPLGSESHIQEEFRWLVEDEGRTGRICDDISLAATAGRNCLVLTRWTDHLERLVAGLRQQGLDPLSLHGGMGKKARAAVVSQLGESKVDDGLLLVATASLLGEGFDCPPLDTLFLAFPIRFRGSVVQYVGRVLRPTETKDRVEVHDYLDSQVPMLARMYDERTRGYSTLGFDVPRRRMATSSRRQ